MKARMRVSVSNWRLQLIGCSFRQTEREGKRYVEPLEVGVAKPADYRSYAVALNGQWLVCHDL
jgi:hypothetical protein